MTRQYNHQGGDQFNFENVYGDVNIRQPRSRKRPDREMTWLKAFEKEIEGRLASSLHNRILINLGKETQPEQVHRVWNMEVKSGQITETILPETEILEVFDRPEIAGKLLILGKPGAGKTTTLLELARALVRRAIDDSNEPMPFLLNLSSWKDPKQSIKDWAIAELITKGIGSKLSKKWIEDQKFLPLFDGLDEVRSDLQPACVRAINRFMSSEEQPRESVVCSRREEYELYFEKLNLNGAIHLQELSDGQIEGYLREVDRASLWQVAYTNAELLALMRQPLWLSIIAVAYQGERTQQWQANRPASKWLAFLLNTYVERMMHRTIKNEAYVGKKPPTPSQTRYWLIKLAKQLQYEAKTEFLIEDVQISWLNDERSVRQMNIVQLAIFWLLLVVIPGVGFGISHALLLDLSLGFKLGLLAVAGMSFNIWVCRFFILWKHNSNQQSAQSTYTSTEPSDVLIKPSFTSTIKLPSSQQEIIHLTKSVAIWLLISLGYGAIVSILIGLLLGLTLFVFKVKAFTSMNIFTSMRNTIFLSSVVGLFGGVTHGLTTNIKIFSAPNQGMWISFKSSVAIASFFALLSCFIAPSVFSGTERPADTAEVYIEMLASAFLLSPLMFSLSFVLSGGVICIRHFSLRLVLFHNRAIPWNYARFLNYATERMFLQRIGGRYRFIHKLLQDHFAQMEE